MAREFRLPDIGEGLTEAEIVRWLVAVGEAVAIDQVVVEVETDKAVVEIPCPFAGVVLHHGAEQGEIVAVGEILVVVGEEGETWPEQPAGDEAAAGGESEATWVAEAPPIVGTISDQTEDLPRVVERAVPPAPDAVRHPRVQALPVVRKLARDLGVDIESVAGTGPHGRITREDVVAAAESDQPTPPESADREDVSAPPPATGERRPLSKLRRTIAANMARSWAEIPHVTTFDDVDATRLLAAKHALEERYDAPVSVDALVVKAVIPALERFPDLEGRWEDGELALAARHDIGVAVDTPEGLLVVVVRDAGSQGLRELSGNIARLAEGARERTLSPGELSGQTFTVSNIGAVGGGHGTPIVPPGTTAILSVGRAVERPVARNERVEIAPVMPLSLSYDHRVVDGALGRRFIAMVIENLAEPALFLAD